MNPPARVVLGLDPGTAILGYAILADEGAPRLVECGVLTTPSSEPHPKRLLRLFDGVCTIIREFRPTELAIEQLFFARNVGSALSVGEARGVVILAAVQAGLSVAEYTPLQVKQAIGGYGRATKDQMREMVRLILALQAAPSPDDAADAVAVGLCHLSWTQHAQAVAAAQRR